MGSPVARLADLCTGHGCYPPRPNIEGSPNVFVNSRPHHRLGDGWSVHCVPGKTMIKTENGFISFNELSKSWKNQKVFSKDSDGTIIKSEIIQFINQGKSKTFIKIEIEDGTLFECTEDHLILLNNGQYKQARDLVENDIL